eukprot:SAG22_NODE_159_length_16948_cov_14.480503_12_plen_855_part_00
MAPAPAAGACTSGHGAGEPVFWELRAATLPVGPLCASRGAAIFGPGRSTAPRALRLVTRRDSTVDIIRRRPAAAGLPTAAVHTQPEESPGRRWRLRAQMVPASRLLLIAAAAATAADSEAPASDEARAIRNVDCQAAMQRDCGVTSPKTPAACLVCMGAHNAELHAAGCRQANFSAFCHGAPTPPAPPSESSCGAAIRRYCNATGTVATCLLCAGEHEVPLNAAGCNQTSYSRYCSQFAPPGPPPPGPGPPPAPSPVATKECCSCIGVHGGLTKDYCKQHCAKQNSTCMACVAKAATNHSIHTCYNVCGCPRGKVWRCASLSFQQCEMNGHEDSTFEECFDTCGKTSSAPPPTAVVPFVPAVAAAGTAGASAAAPAAEQRPQGSRGHEGPAKCSPTARPPELCPGALPCPQCGQAACPCPPPPPPNSTCLAVGSAWCSHPDYSHCDELDRRDNSTSLARYDIAAGSPVRAWRCYSPLCFALNGSYVGGSSCDVCSRSLRLPEIVQQCTWKPPEPLPPPGPPPTTPPPPPAPSPPPPPGPLLPNSTCLAVGSAWCADPDYSHCDTGPHSLARYDIAAGSPVRAWRCYSPLCFALNGSYVGGSSCDVCSRSLRLPEIVQQCTWKPPEPPPTPPAPPPTPTPQPPAPPGPASKKCTASGSVWCADPGESHCPTDCTLARFDIAVGSPVRIWRCYSPECFNSPNGSYVNSSSCDVCSRPQLLAAVVKECKPVPPPPPPLPPCVDHRNCTPTYMTWYNSMGVMDDKNMVHTGANLVWSTNLTDLNVRVLPAACPCRALCIALACVTLLTLTVFLPARLSFCSASGRSPSFAACGRSRHSVPAPTACRYSTNRTAPARWG